MTGMLPPPPDQPAWDAAATKAAVEQLTTIRATAGKWSGTVTALLGIFSSVAIVTGTSTLSDVGWLWARWALFVAVIVAGLLAAGSIWFGAQAAQGSTPSVYAVFNGTVLRDLVADETPGALKNLRLSKRFGFAAAGLVFGIGLCTLVAAIPTVVPPASTYVVIDGNGAVHCGTLTTNSDGTVTAVGGQSIGMAKEIAPTTAC